MKNTIINLYRSFVLLSILFYFNLSNGQNVYHKHVDLHPATAGVTIKDVIVNSDGHHFVLGNHLVYSNGNYIQSTFINSFDQFGNSLWEKSMQYQTMFSIENHTSGKLITGGYYLHEDINSHNRLKRYSVQLTDNTSSGNWIRSLGDAGGECYNAKEDFDNNNNSTGIISCGWYQVNLPNIPLVYKFTNTGGLAFRAQYRCGNETGEAVDICRANNGDYVVAMQFTNDLVITRINSTGGIVNSRRFSLSNYALHPVKIIKKTLSNIETFVILGNQIAGTNYPYSAKGFLCLVDYVNPIVFREINAAAQTVLESTDLKNEPGNFISISSVVSQNFVNPFGVLTKMDLTTLAFTKVKKFNDVDIRAFDNTITDNYYFQDNIPLDPSYDNYRVVKDYDGGNCAGATYSLTDPVFTPTEIPIALLAENTTGTQPEDEILNETDITTENICSLCITNEVNLTLELCPLYESVKWVEPCKLLKPNAKRYRLVSGPGIDPLHPYDSKTGYTDGSGWHGDCNVAHQFTTGTYVIEYLDYETGCVTDRITLNIVNKSIVTHTSTIVRHICILDDGEWLNPCDLIPGYNKYKILSGPGIDPAHPYYSEDGFTDGNGVWHGHCDVSHFFQVGTYTLEYYNDNCEKMTLTLQLINDNPVTQEPDQFLTLHTCTQNDCVWYEPDLPFSNNFYTLTDPDPSDWNNYNHSGERIAHCLIPGVYEFVFTDPDNCRRVKRIVTVTPMTPVTCEFTATVDCGMPVDLEQLLSQYCPNCAGIVDPGAFWNDITNMQTLGSSTFTAFDNATFTRNAASSDPCKACNITIHLNVRRPATMITFTVPGLPESGCCKTLNFAGLLNIAKTYIACFNNVNPTQFRIEESISGIPVILTPATPSFNFCPGKTYVVTPDGQNCCRIIIVVQCGQIESILVSDGGNQSVRGPENITSKYANYGSVGLFKVFPNPSVSIFNIECSDPSKQEGTFSYKLFDNQGKMLLSLDGLNDQMIQQLDLSSYSSGIYMLTIERNGKIYPITLVKP